MSNFSTTGVDTAEKGGKYLNYGINHCKITGMSVMKAGTTDSKKVRFQMEGAAEGAGFEGVDGAKGKVGRVDTNYMSKDAAYKDFMRQIGVIADKLNVRAAVDAVTASTIEDYVAQVEPLLKGKFAWWMFGGEEWDAGKWKMSLLKFSFIKAESEIDPSSLKMDGYSGVELSKTDGSLAFRFDKGNKFHYTPLDKSQNGNAPKASAGLGMLNLGTAGIDAIPFGEVSNAPSKLPFESDDVNDLPFGNQ